MLNSLLEYIILTKNAYFYKYKGNITHSDILDEASSNKCPETEYILDIERKNIYLNRKKYTYSLRIFKSFRPVYFIDEKGGDFLDVIHAYILLVEIGAYLIIFHKSCANISKLLEQNFELVSALDNNAIISPKAAFQKVSVRNITISGNDIRAKSYEAKDLNGLLSMHSLGRGIPHYVKIRQDSSILSLSKTGRVAESTQRIPIEDIILWAHSQLSMLLNKSASNEFLASFSKKVELKDILKSGSTPNAVLFESNIFFELLEKENLAIYRNKNSNLIQVSNRFKSKLLRELERIYELSEIKGSDSTWQIDRLSPKDIVKLNSKTLSIRSSILRKLRVKENGKDITLQSYFKKNKLYSITFTDPSVMYFMDSCFRDNSAVSNIDSILNILHPISNFIVEDEKNPKNDKLNDKSKEFSNKSIFGFIENYHKGDDYIFCDDLGTEWADHITINLSDKSINFIHSKFNDKTTTSASKLHDVVGQAIKNIGYMHFTKEMFLNKIDGKFKGEYYKVKDGNRSIKTEITRIRKGDMNDFEKKLDELLIYHSLHRKCILACPFLSKKRIKLEFDSIKDRKNTKGHISQLLWIISSFIHATKEMNIIPIIYCSD